ncbi:glycoside hydrolase family 92 protein [Gigaspora margarita]|uniref:Glycoside hydrolase family 92 protein n=2 Tax=Gigaspora margarita TaxID=4874 RepID=A0A8H4AV25_GIGMA|nr:glycoside hydrolase family 92 protein [Gigaspora margarita]
MIICRYTVNGRITGISRKYLINNLFNMFSLYLYVRTSKKIFNTDLHVSGTGGEPKYGVISQFPVVDWPDKKIRINDYSSKRSFEHFEVGYSKFGLERYSIMVELTATHRVGLHRYTFPPTENNSKVLLDLSHILSFGWGLGSRFEGGAIISLSLNQIKGVGEYRGGWNNDGPYRVYFCSQFNVNATEQATWWNHRIDKNMTSCVGTSGDKVGAILTFDTIKNPVIISRVGISFISADQACNNAENEIPDWDFDLVKQKAVDAWDNELGQIRIESNDKNLAKIFYSGLYRTLIIPSDRTGENPAWKSIDKYGKLVPYYEDFYTLWDTFRTTNPLFTLFQSQRAVDITRSLIDIYENIGYMPDGRSGSWNGITQGGSNADMIIAETYLKKIDINGKIDWNIAYEALLKDAEVDPWEQGLFQGRLYLTDYKKYGYIPSPYDRNIGYINCPSSRTLEYSANDYSISLVAKELGKINDYIKYKNRATSWENLWCPNITYDGVEGFIIPRFVNGSFDTEWASDDNNLVTSTYSFYESTSWEYSLDIPFDVKRLIQLSGGPKRFENRLDKTFADKTFLGGYYNIGNEPSFFHACLYHFIGKQYKSVEVIRTILKTKFGIGQDGIPGNDDSGAMGSWYAFNVIGIYPLAGTDIYLINSPCFDKVTIYLSISPLKTFTIIAHNLTDINIYVQNVKINDKEWTKTWFRHKDISEGAVMELQMGSEPSKFWGVNGEYEDNKEIEDKIIPPSMSDYMDK